MSKVSLLFNNIIHFSSKKNITSINWNNFADNLLHAKGNKKKSVKEYNHIDILHYGKIHLYFTCFSSLCYINPFDQSRL
jgi:hypothetical protein